MTNELPAENHPRPAGISGKGIARLSPEQEQLIKSLVAGVVRRARLWHSEQNEVRAELFSHFDDGADAGQTAEQLVQDFGSPQFAARLIRQAKLRNRPWPWRMLRLMAQLTTVTVGIVTGCFLVLLARLHLATPGPLPDLVGTLDQSTSKVPAADRAWPFYREGLLLLDRKSLDPNNQLFLNVFGDVLNNPTGKSWPEAIKYLDANARSIDLFVQGSAAGRLGYIYRDPANDAWLKSRNGQSAAETYPTNGPAYEIILPQIQELRIVYHLLHAAALRALNHDDLPGFHKYWQAETHLANQILADAEFPVSQAIGLLGSNISLGLVRYLISEHSELVTDAELQNWRRKMATASPVQRSPTFELHLFCEDLLQNCYMPESQGGRLTLRGCQYLRHQLSQMPRTVPEPWPALLKLSEFCAFFGDVQTSKKSRRDTLNVLTDEGIALRWSTTLANRREMQQKFEQLQGLLDVERKKPLLMRATLAQSPYMQELKRIAETPELFERYWPVVMYMPYVDQDIACQRSWERANMFREGTQATIALEQYRRRTGHWPEKLEQLVPADLSAVPVDVYSGHPLIYKLVQGRPVLYSVGEDSKDNGGQPEPTTTSPASSSDDIQILPVR